MQRPIVAPLPRSLTLSLPCAGALALAALALASLAAASRAPAASGSATPMRSGGPHAGPGVRLKAAFSPERLGTSTTLEIGFHVEDPPAAAPSPVVAVELLYPSDLGIGASGLGLESCTVARLEEFGVAGCPQDSVMGHGNAIVEVPLSADVVLEKAQITLIAGAVSEGHLGLIFYASGEHPVIAQLAFPGIVLPAPAPFGGNLEAQLPLVPSVPEGPDAALIQLETSLGPQHITYHEEVKGRLVSFHPKGILLPTRCPRGGFPFAAHLTFEDGAESSASAHVRCPRRG